MISVEKFEKLKRKVDGIKANVARAEGALSEQMKILKKEHGCSSLEEADKKLEKLHTKASKARDKWDAEIKKFVSKWGDELGIEK